MKGYTFWAIILRGCLCVSACVHVTGLETGCCIDEAGLPIHYYRLGSTTPCHIPPLLTCATSNQPSQSPRSATGGKLYTCTLDTEKNCIQAPGHSRLLSILTHTSGPGPGTVEGREGDMGHDNPSSVAKQSVDPSSSCPGPLLWTGGRKCSADQQQECLLSRVYRQCSGW